jgi:hypothetical protein
MPVPRPGAGRGEEIYRNSRRILAQRSRLRVGGSTRLEGLESWVDEREERTMRSLWICLAPWLLVAACSSDQASDAAVEDTRPVGQLSMNTTSVLLPLPPSLEADRLIRPSDMGDKGVALPPWAMPAPTLVMNVARQEMLDALRIVSVRVDPCYPNIATKDPSLCQGVLHVIWQPVVPAWEEGATTVGTADAAVHAFHLLSAAELSSYLEGVLAIDGQCPADPTGPLRVHPGMAAEGPGGPCQSAFQSLVLKHAGASNLQRMTYMAVRATTGNRYLGQGWLLAGADFDGADAHLVVVSLTSDKEQHFGNNVNDGKALDETSSFKGDFIPTTSSTDALMAIIRDSSEAEKAPEADLLASLEQTYRIENPRLNNLDTVDCASCHVSTQARVWVEQHRGLSAASSPSRFTSSSFDLSLTSDTATRTNSLRGLGYFGSRPAISQRTVNDTAAAAEFVNARLFRRP